MYESEETEEIKTFPSTLTCCKDNKRCPTQPISVGRPGDARYTAPLPHPTTPTGRDEDEDHRHVVPMRDNSPFLSLSTLCSYLPLSRNLVQVITPILLEIIW